MKFLIKLIILILIINKIQCKNLGYNYEPPQIINNDPPSQYGYQYPVPNPPFFDETTSHPHNVYGPPTLDLPNPNVTLPPSNDIPDTYLPPSTLQPPFYDPPPSQQDDDYPQYPQNQYLPPVSNSPPTGLYEIPSVISGRIRVSNMSCFDSPLGGYFRATMTVVRGVVPVLEDVPGDCLVNTGDIFRLDLEGERMKRCGVRFCANGGSMCVSVRMPTVRGLKLPEDGLMTLRCRPQERVVAHTKQLRMNTQNSVQQARNGLQGSTIISGGSQRGFDSQVSLFRRAGRTGNGEFSQLVGPGAAVVLGEELMLRATVRDGDGWRFSRLGDVTVHHVSNGGRTVRQRAVNLLDSSGCRDARTKVICPSDPIQPTPLVTNFGVRAFMFQGMQSGDEMLMSVRIIACLNYEDCHSKTRPCDDPKSGRSTRIRREITTTKYKNTTKNFSYIKKYLNTTGDFQSYLEFRVINPIVYTQEKLTEYGPDEEKKTSTLNSFKLVTIVITSCFIFTVGGLVILILSCARK